MIRPAADAAVVSMVRPRHRVQRRDLSLAMAATLLAMAIGLCFGQPAKAHVQWTCEPAVQVEK